jgi:hypothetical protein
MYESPALPKGGAGLFGSWFSGQNLASSAPGFIAIVKTAQGDRPEDTANPL